ncbi:GyrI-like domain-containing protein [Hymenobacter sp. BRD128]|uniref:GyrI-like domain-containing protein n=1 Tax=Hymenobacter sp. BRD128 TaxID=2675878 RepID=UPI0015659503|nr:GyrI-like domain-containing protein [Hymenobacter sp. BRD128]QKG56060.1 GyrI-like domain-containing protein [Hymenobacter sp. BRD128]
MQPRFETLPETPLAGQRQRLSLLADTTAALWQSFGQRLRARPFARSAERYSVQRYDATYFRPFRPEALFEKWAAVAVARAADVPADLELLVLPAGHYAVFDYQGPASGGPAVFRHLLLEWLPASGYELDDRPHFEVLSAHYRPDDPTAEEQIWLPVKPCLARPL